MRTRALAQAAEPPELIVYVKGLDAVVMVDMESALQKDVLMFGRGVVL